MNLLSRILVICVCWCGLWVGLSSDQRGWAISQPLTDKITPSTVQNRASSVPVASALADITANPSDKWQVNLVENSFHQWVTGSSVTRQQAISIFTNYSTTNKFGFDMFATDTNKYKFSQHCTALALSYGWLYPYLSDVQKQAGQELLKEWGTGLYNYYHANMQISNYNFHTGSVGCLGLIGLILEDEVPAAETWWRAAMDGLKSNYFDYSYNPAGDYWEGYRYRVYSSGPAILFAYALNQSKGIDLVRGQNISQLWNFNIQAYGANSNFPSYGDNTTGAIFNGEDLYLLPYLSSESQKSEALWVWQQIRGTKAEQIDYPYNFKEFDRIGIALFYPTNISPRMPSGKILQVLPSKTDGTLQGSINIPGGMAAFHSGWNSGSSVSFWLVNRWRWQEHQHYDPNTFSLAAYGQTLFGSQNHWGYREELRGKLSQHNLVLIDPTAWYGDAPISPFYTGAAAALGTFIQQLDDGHVAMLKSDARYPMANFSTQTLPENGYQGVTMGYVNPILAAERTVIFAKDLTANPFVVMYDNYQRDLQPHQYRWQAYIPGSASIQGGEGTVANPFRFSVGGVNLKSVFLTQAPFSINLAQKLAGRDDRALQLTIDGQVNAKIVSILLPEKSGVSFTTRQISQSPTVMEINNDSTSVELYFASQDEAINYGGVVSDGQLVMLSKKNGQYDRFVMIGGKNLKVGQQAVVAQTSTKDITGQVGGDSHLCPNKTDLNADGLTDLSDYSILASNWFKTGDPIVGDIDCSGQVDLDDFSILAFSFSL